MAWTIVRHDFTDDGHVVNDTDYDPRLTYHDNGREFGGYLSSNDTLGYSIVEAEGPRLWVLASVIDWNPPAPCPNTNLPDIEEGTYSQPVRLIHFTNAAKTFQYDVPLPNYGIGDTDGVHIGLDMAVDSFAFNGETRYRIFCLAANFLDAEKWNYLYVYEQQLGENKTPMSAPPPTLVGAFPVPRLYGVIASMYYDAGMDRLYIFGRRSGKSATDPTQPGHGDSEVGVWYTSNDPGCWDEYNPPRWEWDGRKVLPPQEVAS